MYTPSFRVKKNGVPVLSKDEIDCIGERYVQDFCPEVLVHPAPVDIESFVENYLGITPDYQYLSHNGVYLGMTVFNDTDKVPVFDPSTGRAEYISAKARTIIIDNRLLEENQQHRYRFTLGHEAGHDIFHSGFFGYNPDQLTLFDMGNAPMVQCRVDGGNADKRSPNDWDDHDRMEWHANRISSAILMPKSAVVLIANEFLKEQHDTTRHAAMVYALTDAFDVSSEAATYRLKDLGFIPKDDMTDYNLLAGVMDFMIV
ncbi:MAG: ImmA/IrrE family metallo-endopeptidase [Clostridia bacterium]|nr:ImmA/IrrE family metallo-endopeptidase [Clostridia bacterium]